MAKYTPTYWNCKGELQEVYDMQHKAIVPETGRAPTLHGNALRQVANLYYEVYNNGGGNAAGQNGFGLNQRYKDAIAAVVEGAALEPEDAKVLRRALVRGNEMCKGRMPKTARRLDEVVTKVVRHALAQTLATIKRPKNNREL